MGRKEKSVGSVLQLQSRRISDTPEYYITSDVIAEILSRFKPMTQRYKRDIRENPDTLKYYLKENLGIEIVDVNNASKCRKRGGDET